MISLIGLKMLAMYVLQIEHRSTDFNRAMMLLALNSTLMAVPLPSAGDLLIIALCNGYRLQSMKPVLPKAAPTRFWTLFR